MFYNAGEKIKFIAKMIFILNVIFAVIGDLLLCSTVDKIFNSNFAVLIFVFLLVACLGVAISWAVALFVYGFGILVSNAEANMYYNDEEYYEEEFEENGEYYEEEY
jgi:hypothetical protein